jgi:hypothetical protein
MLGDVGGIFGYDTDPIYDMKGHFQFVALAITTTDYF